MTDLHLADYLYIPYTAFKETEAPVDGGNSDDSNIGKCKVAPMNTEAKNIEYRKNIRNCEFGGIDPATDAGSTTQNNNKYIINSRADIDGAIEKCSSVTGVTGGKCVFLGPTTKCETFKTMSECKSEDAEKFNCDWFHYGGSEGEYPVGNADGADAAFPEGGASGAAVHGKCYDKSDHGDRPDAVLPVNSFLYDMSQEQNVGLTPNNNIKTAQGDSVQYVLDHPGQTEAPKLSGRCAYISDEQITKLNEGRMEQYKSVMNEMGAQKQTNCNTPEGCACKMCGKGACENVSVTPPPDASSAAIPSPDQSDTNTMAKLEKLAPIEPWPFSFLPFNLISWNSKRPFSTDHGWEIITDYIDYIYRDKWEKGWNPSDTDIASGGSRKTQFRKPEHGDNDDLYSGRCLDYDEIFRMICDYDDRDSHQTCSKISGKSGGSENIWKESQPNELPYTFARRDSNNNIISYRNYYDKILTAFNGSPELTEILTSGADNTKTKFINAGDISIVINKISVNTNEGVVDAPGSKKAQNKALQDVIIGMKNTCGNTGFVLGVGYHGTVNPSSSGSNPNEIKAPPWRQSKSVFVISSFILLGMITLCCLCLTGLQMLNINLRFVSSLLYLFIFLCGFTWIHINIQPSFMDHTVDYIKGIFYPEEDEFGRRPVSRIRVFLILMIILLIFKGPDLYNRLFSSGVDISVENQSVAPTGAAAAPPAAAAAAARAPARAPPPALTKAQIKAAAWKKSSARAAGYR